MAMFWSVVLTIIVLILSLITISQGYGFKHSVDKIDDLKDDQYNEVQRKQEDV